MGRFETSSDFYKYREPYPPDFFRQVAERLQLSKQTSMLDVACGPGNLSLGFAPLVGQCVGIDIEPAMLRLAREAAVGQPNVEFLELPIEEFQPDGQVDFVTIGRALHWLRREATIDVFERIVAPQGYIAICDSKATDAAVNEWGKKFRELRRDWSADQDHSRYNIDLAEWFSTSLFRRVDEIGVEARHLLTIDELVGRALSFSGTSPGPLGAKRIEFETAVRDAMESFAKDGLLEEEIVARASVFARTSIC